MNIKRRISRKIYVGEVAIGGNSPVSVQSMTKTHTSDVARTINQIKKLEEAGCQIVRVAVPDIKSAQAISAIKKEIKIPLVADIHFNYRLGILAMEQGADKIRLNPGNIRRQEEIEAVVKVAKQKKIPIRIGVNSGSIERKLFLSSGNKNENFFHLSQKMVNTGLEYIRLFEKLKFKDIVISLKTPDIRSTVESYRIIAKKVDYPLHLGLTATGPMVPALVKSSIGIGVLLMEGIGDTLRVSLTADPVEEVRAGYEILKALGLAGGIEIISCPACGRCRVNLIKIVREFEKLWKCSGGIYPTDSAPCLKVAIMGCEVNGPGEARDADIGIAFSGKYALLFKNGKPIRKISVENAVQALLREIRKI